MEALFWFGLLIFSYFRWKLLVPLIGVKFMFLFDAVSGTLMAAYLFARPGPWPIVGHIIGAICVFGAYSTARTFLLLSSLKKAETNESNSGPT